MKRRNFFSAILAAGALILSGCGASKGPNTPKANSETLPVLKVEQEKKYYVDNSEDLALQKKMTALMMEAVERSNVDTMKVENLDSFVEKRPLQEISFHDWDIKYDNGLIAHFKHVQDIPGGKPWMKPKYWTNLSGRYPVSTYSYVYKKNAIGAWGNNGKPYAHSYSAKQLDLASFEIKGFKNKKEAMDIYLWLEWATVNMGSERFFDHVADDLGDTWYVHNHFPRLLFSIDPVELEKNDRLIVHVQILEASLKRPLEDLIQQGGGTVVDSPSDADVIIGVKLLGYPRNLKVIEKDLEENKEKLEFAKFQNEISTVNLGGALYHTGFEGTGGAMAGLGVAMALFGGPKPFVHYGAYAIKVIRTDGQNGFSRIVVAQGSGKGLNLVSNDSLNHQLLAYDAASALIGKDIFPKKK